MGVQQDLTTMGDEKLLEYYFNSAAAECGGNPNWDMAHAFSSEELHAELLRRLKQTRLVAVGSDGRLLACELRRVVDLLPAKGRDEYLQDMPKDVREALGRNPG